VRSAIAAAGGVAAAVEDPLRWLGEVTAVAADDSVRTLINRLAVEPPLVREPGKGRQAVDARYVLTVLTQVRIDAVERHRTSLFSRLKRLDPNVHAQEYLAASTELNEVAKYRADGSAGFRNPLECVWRVTANSAIPRTSWPREARKAARRGRGESWTSTRVESTAASGPAASCCTGSR
jgi:hypothetical protein